MHWVAGLEVKGSCDATPQSKMLPHISAEALIHFTLPFRFWRPSSSVVFNYQIKATPESSSDLIGMSQKVHKCYYVGGLLWSEEYREKCLSYTLIPVRHVEPSLLLCRWLSPQLCRKSYLVLPANVGAAMSTQPSLRNLLVWKYHMCSHCLC